MNYKLIVVILLISKMVFSQDKWFHYSWSLENQQDNDRFCAEVYQRDLTLYKDNPYVGKKYKQFVGERILYLQDDMDEGTIYRSFEGKEKYIYRVLQTVTKDTQVVNTIKIVFYRNGSLNASMSESGILRLNVGMLARLNNEAELAILLGHEVGHFINFDAAKHFKKIHENPFFSGNYWYGRDQEEAADFASLAYIKESPYSLKAASNLYRMFKRNEIRWEIKYGKEAYEKRTHPDPGNRMKVVKTALSELSDENRRNFAVDSIEFQDLKRLCFMETVNIGLIENDLEGLMMLTFSRYLYEPTDAYNLAVLIEVLRRYLLLNETLQDKPFILSQYQSNRKEMEANYTFLLKGGTPSILDYLNYGFVDVWKEDINTLKATDLVDQNITEFTTYKEAYAYFKKKAAENKYRSTDHYKFFEGESKPTELEAYKNENTLFQTNTYLSKAHNYACSKKTIIFMPISGLEMIKLCPLDSVTFRTKELNDALFNELTSRHNGEGFQRFRLNELNFEDRHLIQGLLKMGHKVLSMKNDQFYFCHSKMDWASAYPELFQLFYKTGTSDFYICRPVIEKRQVRMLYYKISFPFGTNTTLVRSQRLLELRSSKKRNKFYREARKEFDNFMAVADKK